LIIQPQPLLFDRTLRRLQPLIELGVVLGMSLFFGALAWKTVPAFFSVAFVALLLTLIAWLIKPLAGLHLTIFFTLVGDTVTVGWFPFTKNFSSAESILYVANQATFTPLELVLAAACVSLLLWQISARRAPFVTGPLFKPLAVFTLFVVLGLMYGIGTGGDLRAAIWEVRPFFYLPIAYVLATNLCRTPRHYRQIFWTAMVGITMQSVLSLYYYFDLSIPDREGLESLVEHAAAIHINALAMLLILSLLFKGCTAGMRALLLVMAVPTIWVWIISQRRAAVVALAVAFILLLVTLRWRQRRTFRKFAPVAIIVLVGYLGAFWNAQGSAGFPAQAVKTVIAPGSVSEEDRSSDLYRLIENYDINYTIRSSPILGLGFGQKFLRPVPLPDISFFEFYEYIPHNSLLWVWIKTGFGGFVALLYLFGRSLMLGSTAIRKMVNGRDAAFLTMAVMYVAMYAVFTFVDISWDARSTVFLGLCMSACVNYITVANRHDAALRAAAGVEPESADDDVVIDASERDHLAAAR
jgi:hypothetical protein